MSKNRSRNKFADKNGGEVPKRRGSIAIAMWETRDLTKDDMWEFPHGLEYYRNKTSDRSWKRHRKTQYKVVNH